MKTVLATFLLLSLTLTGARAVAITWGTNVTISADGDVFTNGTFQYAYDWDGSNATVNGIAFTGTSSTSGGTNVSLSGIGSNYHGYTSTTNPFSALSAAYQSILAGGEYGGAVTAMVTISNLTIGRVYAVQVWVNDPRGGSEAGRTETVTSSNVVTLAYNVPAAAGGVGQYTIGVFTASATNQTFTLLGGASTQLNALLVSDVTTAGYQPVNPPPPPSLYGQSAWVYYNSNHFLVYSNDNLGNHLPDFSFAGYGGGGVAIPTNMPVKTNLSAIAGDNTANLQNAINYVSGLTPDANGFRGVVLLNPGTYPIAGTLTIGSGGVILRGSGNDTNTGTVLLVTGLSRNVITVGGSGSWVQTGNTYTITDPYVPLGATSFHVSSGVTWGTNVTIVVQRPQTQSWIDAIGMNSLNNPWTPGGGLYFERQISAVNGNQITIDVPLCNPIESDWTTGQVFQVTDSSRIQQVGIENLCGVGQIADYPSNILNGTFIVYQNLKNGWAQDILMSGWGNGISLNTGLKWCTVQDCQYVNPATANSSAAPAAYTVGDSGAMCLFQRCASDGGYYHIMVTQAGTPGPNVFLNFNCTGTHYNGGPHQRWAAGALHDNIIMAADSQGGYTPYLAINNRGNDGSGQGWAAGFSVMYDCQVPQFQLEQPATTTNQYNWTIGGIGSMYNYGDNGIYDAPGSIVNPRSLYLEQLRERLGGAAIENIGYPLFSISTALQSQSVAPGTNATFSVNVGDPTLMSNIVALSVSGLPANAGASFNTNSVTGAGSATLTFVASNSVAPGNYILNVIGANAGLTHTTQVCLVVARANPGPKIAAAVLSANQFIVSGTNGAPDWTYFVLSSTNVALPVANWQVIATNQFDGGGNFVFTNAAPAGGQIFYLLKLQ